MGLSRCARWAWVIASKARYGPIPLRLALVGRSAGSVLRALRRLWGRIGAFALCARGLGDRLQGLLRTDPAPLGVFGAPRDRDLEATSSRWPVR